MKKDPGWTMIETVIVIAISLILSAGVGLPAMQYIERAKVSSARMQLEAYRLALQSYYLDCGRYPNSVQGLPALNEKPLLAPVPRDWNGPYLEKALRPDPWGNDWVYRCPENSGDLGSYYPRGRTGKQEALDMKAIFFHGTDKGSTSALAMLCILILTMLTLAATSRTAALEKQLQQARVFSREYRQ